VKKRVFILIIILGCLAFLGIVVMFSVNAYVKHVGGKNLLTTEEAAKLQDVDCIIVLGCQVRSDGRPSDMLSDRLMRGISLYQRQVAPKMIMSGDHGQHTYDEVNTMKNVAVSVGIPSSDVFMDHAGFSTYESMYRAKEVFEAKKVVVVSQEYHLYRALYIAEKLGLEAYGVHSDYRRYLGQTNRELREVLARCKDFVQVAFKPEPTFLGNAIPVSGDGNMTND